MKALVIITALAAKGIEIFKYFKEMVRAEHKGLVDNLGGVGLI